MLARSISSLRAGGRPLSTTAAALPAKAKALSTRPPKALFGIAGRYASAIYSAAAKKGELELVEEDLKVCGGRPSASAVVGPRRGSVSRCRRHGRCTRAPGGIRCSGRLRHWATRG